MPSSWTAFFCWYGLYPSRWPVAPESTFSPPSWLGTSLRHVGKSYFSPFVLRTFKHRTTTRQFSFWFGFFVGRKLVSSLWLSFIVLKGDAKLSSSVKLMLQQRKSIHHHLLVSSFLHCFQPVATCPLMAFFSLSLFADSAHLLHTRLPLCYSQLFFQP